MFDFDAYLERIGLTSSGDLAELHRAHVTSIPFENLDPRAGIPVSLTPEDLQQKLIRSRRGGYCFEQNLLLASALEARGIAVEPMLARVRVGGTPAARRPRTHLILRVHFGGQMWHADVGFGRGTPLEPLPFGPAGEHEQSGWRYRVVEDGAELVLQTMEGGEWIDLYGFAPEPVPLIDVELSNWFTCTYPRSPFVTGLHLTAHHPDGSRSTLSDRDGLALTEQTPRQTTVTPVAWSEVPELLEERFGLDAALGEQAAARAGALSG